MREYLTDISFWLIKITLLVKKNRFIFLFFYIICFVSCSYVTMMSKILLTLILGPVWGSRKATLKTETPFSGK